MLSPKERAAVKGLLGKARFADVAPRLFGSKATRGSILGTLGNAKGTYDLLTKNRLSHSFAKSLNEPLKSGWRTGIGALGVGAAVGGGGASVQYSKGRGSEKRFQRRLAMNKLSSVQDAALWSSFDLEISKISGAKNIAYGAGKSVRAIVDALDKLKQGPSGLYRSYAKGYHKVPRNIKDVVTKGKEAVPAAMLLIPGAAGVGAAVGAYAKSKLKRKEEPADAFAHRGYSEPEYGEGY
jgi:hypothetical protein